MNQALPAAEHSCARLLINCLGLHEAHLRLAGCDNDCLN